MRLKVCICVYFFAFFTFTHCDETKKELTVTTDGTVKEIKQTESTLSTEHQMAVTTEKSLLATTTTKTTEDSNETLTAEKTTKVH